MISPSLQGINSSPCRNPILRAEMPISTPIMLPIRRPFSAASDLYVPISHRFYVAIKHISGGGGCPVISTLARQTGTNLALVKPRWLDIYHVSCPWWRHQMETFSALLDICAGNSPVPVDSPHKGQWRGALMFSLICVWINGWVNNGEAGDLRRYRVHYDVSVLPFTYRHIGCQVITWTTWTYADILSIEPLGTQFIEIKVNQTIII